MEAKRFLIIFGVGFLSVFALVGGILGYFFFIKTDFLQSPGIDGALGKAQSDARVIELLGEPVTQVKARGGVSRMSVNEKVDLVLGLGGPRGEADLDVTGFRIGQQGVWEYCKLELTQGERRLDLLAGK